ncbi:MAG: indolepyruvate ferredoxin oxidoreductase family protein [Chloroflexota bacterium]|nr:indolepyruvate ferredoxin oxidoreductase family protein [Chloroflexota bacterium]MDE2947669.1 indolepyruvate ferredoxin oxidoreductase family protein [Chloroflexota bacterium]
MLKEQAPLETQISAANFAEFTLEDRYTVDSGRVIMSGIQALARLPMDQHRADKRRGLRTASLITGYRGSPLGALDFVLESIPGLLAEHHVRFVPAVNEELAATAIMGSQTVNMLPGPKYDGVCGIWYGKGPGVDRSGDAFKHANLAGVGKHGGVLALAGDDPSCKSSTIPSHSEVALFDALMPILYPGSAQEILDFGLLGFGLSRFSGLWIGFKIVTDVADEYSSVDVGLERVSIVEPEFELNGQRWRPRQNSDLIAPYSLQQEQEIHDARLDAALAFAKANRINKIAVPTADAWLGIIAAGKTWHDLRGALLEIGLDDGALEKAGIRLLKLGMIFPLERGILREFAAGLEEILVIEEKRSFIEMFCKDALYGSGHAPLIVGKKDEAGNKLVKADYELDADEIVKILGRRLPGRVDAPLLERRLREINRALDLGTIPIVARSPYFCSGCPHNRSTKVPAGSMAVAGIGCHTLAILMDRETGGVTQMGGEGANWVGAETFSDIEHIFQNIGDGTFAHSGSLSIRQATAAGTTMTFKILYNSAVAMTGGQPADGLMPVPELTHLLFAEGVKKTIVVADDPDKFPPDAPWAPGAEVWERDRLEEAQLLLRDTAGVTALVYDQECAANLRRKRRRGYAPDPSLRIVINEAVCEGCGDCGSVSNCLSVQPVETEFGRKTQIHQSSCNKDYTCLDGNCPAFMSVIPDDSRAVAAKPSYRVDHAIAEPARRINGAANILFMGIGGTGVVTSNQVLGTAAALEGYHVRSLDQTGLSQKGGPVVSNLKISSEPIDSAPKIGAAAADAFLVFDALTATEGKNLIRAHPQRSVAIVSSSQVPTGAMVRDTTVEYPEADHLLELINRQTLAGDNVFFDAIGLAEALFHDHMMANMIVIGAAYQAGTLPMSAAAIERAIALNGVKVEDNQHAFRAGRLAVAEPGRLAKLELKRSGALEMKSDPSPAAKALINVVGATGELKRLLEIRAPELIAYQNEAYARTYIDDVKRVYAAEQRACPGAADLSEAFARYLFKLMAYKDEYEVARLSLKGEVQAALAEQFGARAKMHYHLQPPILKALGLKRKIKVGRWFTLVYRGLRQLRGLRGTPFDIFGYDHVRRTERDLIAQYRRLIFDAAEDLSRENYDRAVKLAALPDIIRGYDEVKLGNVARFWEAVRALGYSPPGD